MNIDLAQFKTEGAWVFSGRPRGTKIRERVNVDAIDQTDEATEVQIPTEILGINPSFFLGLFGPSVRKFGREGFESKYHFKCNPLVLLDIEDGINQALKETNPLSK